MIRGDIHKRRYQEAMEQAGDGVNHSDGCAQDGTLGTTSKKLLRIIRKLSAFRKDVLDPIILMSEDLKNFAMKSLS